MAWDSIRGHDEACRQLLSANSRGRLAHAFLFVGPAGVGKRVFATELTRALLCDRPPAPLTACDHCPSCAQVTAGTHPDAFTARKPEEKHDLPIDVVREFCTNLGRKPAKGTRKVGVIEDADDFNDESANCFLKTLEEPPPGAVLILLATDTERQLPTILSRCQVVRFRPLCPDDLKRVLADHGVTDPAQVDRLVRLAGGSPGRALALNDDALWTFRETLLAAIIATKPDPVGIAAAWGKFVDDAGKESSLQRQRASLVIQLTADALGTALRLATGGEAGEDRLRRLAERTGPDQLADLLESCVEAHFWIERKVQTSLVIELFSDKLCRVTSAA